MEDFVYNITGSIYTQIVKEQDNYTMQVINDYIKKSQMNGEIISSNIIGEGNLRHIINVGLERISAIEKLGLGPGDLFEQEQYIEYLRKELNVYQQENEQLRKRVEMLEELSGLRSTETILGGNESEEI